MEFKVPAPNTNFRLNEKCPKCEAIITITDKTIITGNKLITCELCNYKFRLNINP